MTSVGDGLGAELATPLLRQRVGLVDEQHATERPTDDLLDLERRLADVARDEIGPRDLDELAAADDPDAAVQPGDDPRDGRLAGAGRPGEDDVEALVDGRQAGRLALGVEHLDGDQAPDRGLDRDEADERVELGEDRRGRLALRWGCAVGRCLGVGRGPVASVAAVVAVTPVAVASASVAPMASVGPVDGVAGVVGGVPVWICLSSSTAAVFAVATESKVASAASAAGETVGVWYDSPCGSRSALTVPAGTSVGAPAPSATRIPHSTCRGSTVGCE